jgi:N-acetyl-beta-hexosaminidase
MCCTCRPRSRSPAAPFVRALETCRQLVLGDGSLAGDVRIVDGPTHNWRGFLVDTARHFLPVCHAWLQRPRTAALRRSWVHCEHGDPFASLSDCAVVAGGGGVGRQVPAMKRALDSFAAAKLNVLHWHIMDAQSFPLLLKSDAGLAERVGVCWRGGWFRCTPPDPSRRCAPFLN